MQYAQFNSQSMLSK